MTDDAVAPFAAAGILAGRVVLEAQECFMEARHVDDGIGTGDGGGAIWALDGAPNGLAWQHPATLRATQRLEVHTNPGGLSEINYIAGMPNYQPGVCTLYTC